MPTTLPRTEWLLLFGIPTALAALAHILALPLAPLEQFGFAVGGICVWLTVRQHLLTWPIGLVSNVVFFVLFLQSRLYADMGLQLVYFALGIWGWWNWLFGGVAASRLQVSHTQAWEWWTLAAVIPLATFGLHALLLAVNGAAPFWDALTTVLSLAAQYLLGRKRLENWWFWMTADLIYIPLYASRGLPLTAVLYAVFLALCVLGYRQWRQAPGSAV